MTIAAVILCGGESRRMGRPKAWLPFGAEVMLQRVVRLVGTVAGPIVVVAAPGQDLPALPAEVSIVRDEISGRGPLQGLAAGFVALGEEVDLAYATSTDVPFLEPRWITRLAELIGDADLAIPSIGGYFHPLAALYRKKRRPAGHRRAAQPRPSAAVLPRRGCPDASCPRARNERGRPAAWYPAQSESAGGIRAGAPGGRFQRIKTPHVEREIESRET